MQYRNIVTGTFLSRPNRFIAHVNIGGQTEVCHVKNTGRCRELLIPGATVYLEDCASPTRRTRYDLIAVQRGTMLVNMDSQAPNRVAAEYLPMLYPGLRDLRAECFFGHSRFDFRFEQAGKTVFAEVKGVTLERGGGAFFPDAPTLRGVRHVQELCQCAQQGYGACILFVIQMRPVQFFAPNMETQPEFAQVLQQAADCGVRIHAVDCVVTPDTLTPGRPVPIRL